MKQEVLVSIIVPVYNVERYLKRCVDSLRMQTYHNIEIILVNDGSTDNCKQLCRELEKLDERIVLISKNNGGLSSARNAGLLKAKGDYITFVDSDDYVSLKYIEVLLELCIKYDAEMAQCSIVEGYQNNYAFNENRGKIVSYSGIEYLRNMYSILYSECAPCKLYKRDLFCGIEFPVGRIMEDVATTYKVIYRASKIVCVENQLYYYFQSPDSIIRGNFNLSKLSGLKSYKERLDFFYKIGEQTLYERALQQYGAVLLKWYYCVKKYFPNEREIIVDMHRKICDIYEKIKSSKVIIMPIKMCLLIGTVFPYGIGKVCDKLIL